MSYALPLSSDPRREMFDVFDLVSIGTGETVPLDLPAALRSARRTFAATGKAARRLNYIVLRADDTLQLISVGRRGGWKVVWTFGPYVMPRAFRPGVPPIPADHLRAIMGE